MPKLDCGAEGSRHSFILAAEMLQKKTPIAAEAQIQSFAKVAEEKNRELLSLLLCLHRYEPKVIHAIWCYTHYTLQSQLI